MDMVFETYGLQEAQQETSSGRKCLVEGKPRPKSELIRFVVGPENRIVPDLAERLPGRGMWVSASRASLEVAVKKNLFSKAAKTSVKADADLPDIVEKLLHRRCLDILGMAKGAGAAVAGQAQVEEAQSSRELSFVLVASDAGADGVKKLKYSDIVTCGLSRVELGGAMGRGELVYIGLRPHPLTEKLRCEIARWNGVKNLTNDLSHN